MFFKKNSSDIRRANRKLSSKKKGSNNRMRTKLVLERVHRKTANQRKDYHFKLADS